MTSWTIFGLGIIAGIIWFGLAILVAAWFSRMKSLERVYGEETGTETPHFDGNI